MTPVSADRTCSPLLLPSPITRTLHSTPAQAFINEAGIYKARQLREAPQLNHKTEGGNCNSSLQRFINIHHRSAGAVWLATCGRYFSICPISRRSSAFHNDPLPPVSSTIQPPRPPPSHLVGGIMREEQQHMHACGHAHAGVSMER